MVQKRKMSGFWEAGKGRKVQKVMTGRDGVRKRCRCPEAGKDADQDKWESKEKKCEKERT